MQRTNYTAIYSAAAQKQGSAVYRMLQDGQGSTRQLLASAQVTQASYISDAYGNSVSSTGTATNPLKWNGGSGYYSDGESGLQKVGARYYEPATGRWLTQDTMIIAGSPFDSQAINRYLYCGGRAVGASDPAGHQAPIAYGLLLLALTAATHALGEWLTRKIIEEAQGEADDVGKNLPPSGGGGSGPGGPSAPPPVGPQGPYTIIDPSTPDPQPQYGPPMRFPGILGVLAPIVGAG